MTGIHPLFKWFGSKWQAAPRYPKPLHKEIVEPFAGGAGYSLRYPEHDVIICDNNPNLKILWPWLIDVATESMIREIPINVPEGTDIRTLGLSDGQAYLLKTWQRTNTTGDCWTISPWGNLPGQWTANTRARVAEEVFAVKHWTFLDDGLRLMQYASTLFYNETDDVACTWFVDPMYQYNYQYNTKDKHDYNALGALCQNLSGQVIVCEAVCPKTGKIPDWLPFRHFGESVTSRRKKEQNHHSKELVWTNA
jgi:site-specific DNA-adenine methylase